MQLLAPLVSIYMLNHHVANFLLEQVLGALCFFSSPKLPHERGKSLEASGNTAGHQSSRPQPSHRGSAAAAAQLPISLLGRSRTRRSGN